MAGAAWIEPLGGVDQAARGVKVAQDGTVYVCGLFTLANPGADQNRARETGSDAKNRRVGGYNLATVRRNRRRGRTRKSLSDMAGPTGLEPATTGSTIRSRGFAPLSQNAPMGLILASAES